MTALQTVEIFTDGACRGSLAPAVRAHYCVMRDTKEIYGAERMTTNNRMELTAAIQALAALKIHVR